MAITKATASAVAPAAKGDLVVGSATNDAAVLGVGSTDQVLTVDSSTTTGLKWATPAAGGMTLISETVASAISSLSLSSIPGTYKQLLLTWQGIYHSSSGNFFTLRINNSSSTVYKTVIQAFSGNTVQNETRASETSLYVGAPYIFGSEANFTTEIEKMVKGYILIDNYASTTKTKFLFGSVGYSETSQFRWANFNATFNSTSAITSLDVVRVGGTGTFSNYTDTSIRLYGVS